LDTLLREKDALESAVAAQRGEDVEQVARRLVEAAEELADGGRLVRGSVELPEGTDLAEFGDRLRAALDSGAAIVHVHIDSGKDAFLGVVTDDWIGQGVKAGDLVREASRATGSGGGGRPHLAQGGVGNAAQVPEALEAAVRAARRVVESS
jgi:alanyl-tRNA synthetase